MRKIKLLVSTLLIICMAFSLAACQKVEDSGSIGTVAGTAINSQYYRFMTEYYKVAYNNGMPGMTEETLNIQYDETQTLGQFIKEAAYDEVISTQLLVAKAKEEGIVYSQADHADQVTAFKSSLIAQFGGDSAYKDWLKEINVSEATMENFFKDTIVGEAYIATKEADFEITDEDAKKYFDENYMVAKHILFAFGESAVSADQVVEPEEGAEAEVEPTLAPEEVQAKAQKYYEDIKAGRQNFDTVMNELSDDPGSLENPDGYLFTEGEMVTEFYEGAKALKVGEISEPVESMYGYHIIKRMALDSYPDGFESMKETIKSNLYWEKFRAYVDSLKEQMEITRDDATIDRIAKETLYLK